MVSIPLDPQSVAARHLCVRSRCVFGNHNKLEQQPSILFKISFEIKVCKETKATSLLYMVAHLKIGGYSNMTGKQTMDAMENSIMGIEGLKQVDQLDVVCPSTQLRH